MLILILLIKIAFILLIIFHFLLLISNIFVRVTQNFYEVLKVINIFFHFKCIHLKKIIIFKGNIFNKFKFNFNYIQSLNQFIKFMFLLIFF